MMTGMNNLRRTVVDYFFVFFACTAVFQAASSAFAEELYGAPVSNIAAYLDNLIRSYPDWIASRTDEYLSMKNGVKFAGLLTKAATLAGWRRICARAAGSCGRFRFHGHSLN